MSTAVSPTTSGAGPSSDRSQPTPAAPPSRMEIERKLSFKSAAGPRSLTDSPKKQKKPSANAPPSAYPPSGYDSDGSSITSSSHPQLTSPTHPSSPLLTPNTGSVGGLSAIAEKGKAMMELDEMELHDVEEEGEGDGEEGEESEAEENVGGELQRGMEGERVLKSGYLMKKQERRKAWKRKWFVLRTGKLAYYKDDREYSLKKVLDLKSVQTVAPVTVKKHSFSFGIVTSKRTFLAKASSQDEMDDWVRAINTARRKLSEREEEDRHKRPGTTQAMAVPMRERPEQNIETHQGTYGSVFSTTTGGSITSSPVASTGYFSPHPASVPQHPYGGSPMASPIGLPSSPMDTTNSLTGQVAMMSMNKSPSSSSAPRIPQNRILSSSSARREPSASSISSSVEYQPPQGGLIPGAFTQSQQAPSSDEDEPYFSDPTAAFPSIPNPHSISATPIDPNKVILSAYLMKRSKGRTTGRKVWRKRWFYLTSQGLTYTKSHMDSRALRFIPLSAVLDALEFDTNGSADDATDSDPDAPGASSPQPTSLSFSTSRRGRDGTPAKKYVVGDKPGSSGDEHLFRLITAKRTYVLCAPSEEDEIKWLAAFRALLNRQRDWSGDGNGGNPPLSPTLETAPRLTPLSAHQMHVPTITQQPPTPAGSLPTQPASAETTPAVSTAQGPPVLERPVDGNGQQSGGQDGSASIGNRGRSATYIAKGAVADVVRRYHPETPPPVPQSHIQQ